MRDDASDDATRPRTKRRTGKKSKSRRKGSQEVILRALGYAAAIHGFISIVFVLPRAFLLTGLNLLSIVIFLVISLVIATGITGALGGKVAVSREHNVDGRSGIILGIGIVEVTSWSATLGVLLLANAARPQSPIVTTPSTPSVTVPIQKPKPITTPSPSNNPTANAPTGTVPSTTTTRPSSPSTTVVAPTPTAPPQPATSKPSGPRRLLSTTVVASSGDVEATAKQALSTIPSVDQQSIRYSASTTTLSMAIIGASIETGPITKALESAGIQTRGVRLTTANPGF